MKRKSLPAYNVCSLVIAVASWVLAGCHSSPAPITEKVIVVETVYVRVDTPVLAPPAPPSPLSSSSLIPADKELNHLAMLIAGLDSLSDHDHKGWNKAFLRAYARRIEYKMRKMREGRLRKMMDWNRVNMQRNNINGERFAFYPFAGGDLIHLAWLYPDADTYLLVAREDVGYIPDLLSSDEKFLSRYLRDVDTVLRDIYKRSYFITKNMQEDTRNKTLVNGMLPLVVWTIAQLDMEILSLDYFFVNASGQKDFFKEYDKNRPPHGVEIKVRKKGSGKERKVIYLSCDISDRGFKRSPRFLTFLDATVPEGCNSFVKSASYLLHYSSFETIRKRLLSKSSYHIQDDTGIPYKYFDKGVWRMELHGHYYKPISAFSPNLMQGDLKKAYGDSSLYKGELPFSLGYHWNTRKQNQIIAIRK